MLFIYNAGAKYTKMIFEVTHEQGTHYQITQDPSGQN